MSRKAGGEYGFEGCAYSYSKYSAKPSGPSTYSVPVYDMHSSTQEVFEFNTVDS